MRRSAVFCGAGNFTKSAFRDNYENFYLIDQPAFAAAFADHFDERGEVGWIAPSVFGFNAEPVDVTDLDDGSRTDMLYLGGDGDVYLLVDPCDGSRVDFVPVGETQMTVIDRVRCG